MKIQGQVKDTKTLEQWTRELLELSRKINSEISDCSTYKETMIKKMESVYGKELIKNLFAAQKLATDALERGDSDGFNKAIQLAVDLIDEM